MGCVRFFGCVGAAMAATVLGISFAVRHRAVQLDLPWQHGKQHPAVGIEYHYFPEGDELLKFCASDALVIDVDLVKSRYRPYVACEDPNRKQSGLQHC